MSALLLVVTGASLLLAGFMSAVAWRMAREERRRSDARVAMLAAEIYKDEAPPAERIGRVVEQAAASSWTRSLVTAIAGAGVVVTIGVVAIFGVHEATDRSPEGSRSMNEGSRPAMAGRSARLQPGDQAPLELLALEHERDGERLVVRGIVRNPANAMERDDLAAVVLLVGRDGDVVSSARAALPVTKLAPGATAPFVVNVTHAADVDRFRVSFRSDARVEPHVDRRTS
jgi:hypothetical protein